jgi:hypothetical protein
MSTLTISSPARFEDAGYLQNVGRAARALLAAVFAVQPTAKAAAVDKHSQVSLTRLYRLARSYDSVMPNLAQEMRAIAKRG